MGNHGQLRLSQLTEIEQFPIVSTCFGLWRILRFWCRRGFARESVCVCTAPHCSCFLLFSFACFLLQCPLSMLQCFEIDWGCQPCFARPEPWGHDRASLMKTICSVLFLGMFPSWKRRTLIKLISYKMIPSTSALDRATQSLLLSPATLQVLEVQPFLVRGRQAAFRVDSLVTW